VLKQITQTQLSPQYSDAAKHSQYFLMQCERLQWQPRFLSYEMEKRQTKKENEKMFGFVYTATLIRVISKCWCLLCAMVLPFLKPDLEPEDIDVGDMDKRSVSATRAFSGLFRQ
jgi:hypothetical protein